MCWGLTPACESSCDCRKPPSSSVQMSAEVKLTSSSAKSILKDENVSEALWLLLPWLHLSDDVSGENWKRTLVLMPCSEILAFCVFCSSDWEINVISSGSVILLMRCVFLLREITQRSSVWQGAIPRKHINFHKHRLTILCLYKNWLLWGLIYAELQY